VIGGTVRDSATGAGIEQAEVSVVGANDVTLRTTSGDSGHYRLSGLRPGVVLLAVRRVGYYPDTARVRVLDSGVTRVDFKLQSSTVLEAQVSEADPLRGKMGPFNRRRARGVGAFVTRAEIEKRQPGSISELLRYLPGVAVTQKMAGEPQPVHMQRSVNSTTQANCNVLLYVDGHPYPNGNVDDFSPIVVEGIEVYRSASEIPADFRTRDATCGVIAIWTRDPESRPQKP
jgi:hypothetical protein